MDTSLLYMNSVARLALLFHDNLEELGEFAAVQAIDLPTDAQTLLAHTNHMTVTLEAFHNSLVDVEVIAELSEEDCYSREILLRKQIDRSVVQYGIMRIWLDSLPREVSEEIQSREFPLGRVLIRHNLLREIDLMTFWQVEPSAKLLEKAEASEETKLFGRTAQILVDERPTVQLLEMVKC